MCFSFPAPSATVRLEHFMIGCGGLAVGEDKAGKQAEAGDALASSMQAAAASRSHSQAKRYRQA